MSSSSASLCWPKPCRRFPKTPSRTPSSFGRACLFHNGEEFTSADVKYYYEWNMDPANATINGTLFAAVESVEAPDPYTVVVKLKQIDAAFFDQRRGHLHPEFEAPSGSRRRRVQGRSDRHRRLHAGRLAAGVVDHDGRVSGSLPRRPELRWIPA